MSRNASLANDFRKIATHRDTPRYIQIQAWDIHRVIHLEWSRVIRLGLFDKQSLDCPMFQKIDLSGCFRSHLLSGFFGRWSIFIYLPWFFYSLSA